MSHTGMAGGPLPEPPWDVVLAAYFILIGVPSGITLVSWWLRRRYGSSAKAIERYGSWVALTSLIIASVILIVDLGRPTRFYLMLTRFDNLGSPIAVGAKLIALKMVLLAAVLYAMERRRRATEATEATGEAGVTATINAALPWFLVACSFALAIYPAAVLARSWASPLADSSGSALIFFLTALLMGMAVAILISALLRDGDIGADERQGFLRTGRTSLLSLVGILGLTLAFEGLSIGGNPPDRRILHDLLTGGLAATFWGLVVVVGMAVPAIGLALAPARRANFVVCAVAVLIGAAATRYLIFAAR